MLKYGPLNYITDLNDDEGNYYWPGPPPVGYDDIGIPIDEFGNQCLPGECILHLNHIPTDTEWNNFLGDYIPTLESCRSWFDDNFLIISDDQLKKYILRWYWWNNQYTQKWKIISKGLTVPEMIGKIWPDVHKS